MKKRKSDYVRNYALNSYSFSKNREDNFIAKLTYKNMKGQRVLDLGCGPVVSITSLFYPNAKEVVAVDRLKENLDFVKNNSHELHKIIKNALIYKHRFLSTIDANPKIKLVMGDVTSKLKIGKFNSVMQIGCFGCLDTEEEFRKAVENAYSYLRKGGILLMINWLGNGTDAEDLKYRFDGNVNLMKIYIPTLKNVGFKIVETHKISSILSKNTKKMGYGKLVYSICRK